MSHPILFDVTHTFGYPHNTGVQRVVRRLAVWARAWPNTTFIRFDRGQQDFVTLSEADIDFLIDGWSMTPRPFREPNQGLLRRLARSLPGSQRIIDTLRTWRTTRAFAQKPRGVDFRHAVYVTAEVFGDADRTAALSWWRGQGLTKVVLVLHDLIPYFHPEWAIFNPRHFRNYMSIVGCASLLAPVSRHTRDQVTLWFGDQHRPLPRLEVIRPGFDLPGATDGTPERARDLGQVLACVGTIEARKNQLRVLQAIRKLWDEGKVFSFVFAGKEADRGEFRRAYAQTVAEGYPVHWWTPASDDEVEWLYGHALATVYPSLSEGFGLPVVESLARGTPCVTSAGGATGETADDLGGCLTVDPLDITSIQSTLGRLLDQPNLRTELAAGFHREKVRLWKDYSRDLQALVEELAD